METLKSALSTIQPGDWFGSLDLKDAYFSISVAKQHRKYLRFIWKDRQFQFCDLPQGLSSSPRVFTKVLKPMYATLRQQGHSNVPYIDDSLLRAPCFDECCQNINNTVELADRLGFTVHPVKSVVEPTQVIVFLGFILNSINMTVRLTPDRIKNFVELCMQISSKVVITIREFATVIGKMVAAEPGIEYAPLYYKRLRTHSGCTIMP